MDAGPESITEADVLGAVRTQARRVQGLSLLTATALTALYLLLT